MVINIRRGWNKIGCPGSIKLLLLWEAGTGSTPAPPQGDPSWAERSWCLWGSRGGCSPWPWLGILFGATQSPFSAQDQGSCCSCSDECLGKKFHEMRWVKLSCCMKVGNTTSGKGYERERERSRGKGKVLNWLLVGLRPRLYTGKFKQRAGIDWHSQNLPPLQHSSGKDMRMSSLKAPSPWQGIGLFISSEICSRGQNWWKTPIPSPSTILKQVLSPLRLGPVCCKLGRQSVTWWPAARQKQRIHASAILLMN